MFYAHQKLYAVNRRVFEIYFIYEAAAVSTTPVIDVKYSNQTQLKKKELSILAKSYLSQVRCWR